MESNSPPSSYRHGHAVHRQTFGRRSRARTGRALDDARALIARYLGPIVDRDFAVRYWDGSVDRPPSLTEAVPVLTIVLRHERSARRMFVPPTELRLGEAFVRGDFDVEGDLERAVALAPLVAERMHAAIASGYAIRLIAQAIAARLRNDVSSRRRRSIWYKPHSRARDRSAVRSHYDLGNEFYSLWLDKRMIYSCAYFETGLEDINQAQEAKIEHICKKLRLEPGDRLLDIGCGWGGLIRHAAARYGVRAIGITLSEAQASFASESIAAEGLSDVCSVRVEDYRDTCESVPFDKVVSVGMVEHVGRAQLPTYFRKVDRLLRPGGLFLNHGIVQERAPGGVSRLEKALWQEGEFIDRYVFPDGELVSLGRQIMCAEQAGFETRDAEGLREHYAMTLRHWGRRLVNEHGAIVRLVGEEVYRTWRLYMAASGFAFSVGRQNIVQTLFSKPTEQGRSAVPLTRRDLYELSTSMPIAARLSPNRYPC